MCLFYNGHSLKRWEGVKIKDYIHSNNKNKVLLNYQAPYKMYPLLLVLLFNRTFSRINTYTHTGNCTSYSNKSAPKLSKQRKLGNHLLFYSVLKQDLTTYPRLALKSVLLLPQSHTYWDYRHLPPRLAISSIFK